MLDTDNFEGEELDIEPFEGEPDWDGPLADENDLQDDEGGYIQIRQFAATAPPQKNTWKETLDWYKKNNTKAQIGFDPDGMCLKVCRIARNIPARYLSAKTAQDATPTEHRITQVRNFRRGMVAYFDTIGDDNRFGHIVTIVGRVKGFDPDSLHDVLVETNSVKSDELVVVRGDYFKQHWGDDFKFAATWLNGYELDLPNVGTKVERFHDTAPEYDLGILARAGKDRPRAQRALNQIMSQVNRLPDSPKLERVSRFKRLARDEKILDLRILDKAVEDGRKGLVRRVRDEIRELINLLPDE